MKTITLLQIMLFLFPLLTIWTDQSLESTDGTQWDSSMRVWQSYTVKNLGDLYQYDFLMKKSTPSSRSEFHKFTLKTYKGEGINPSLLLGSKDITISFTATENTFIWKSFYLGGVGEQTNGQKYTVQIIYRGTGSAPILAGSQGNAYHYGVSSVSSTSDLCFKVLLAM